MIMLAVVWEDESREVGVLERKLILLVVIG